VEIPSPSGHDDTAFAGVAARSPEEVALMAADGGRQTVFRTEQIDGSGLPVGLTKNRGLETDFGREFVIDARHGGRHLLPAELVGESLRQWAELVRLDGGRGEM